MLLLYLSIISLTSSCCYFFSNIFKWFLIALYNNVQQPK
ncbi:hypothetical protein EC1011_2445 [Escherichia coli 101-1]|nr:hypothetical protein EC1011_2445 [Escherichia coli 101-1]